MYIAQINISRLLEPIDSLLSANFVADLDRINADAHHGSIPFCCRTR